MAGDFTDADFLDVQVATAVTLGHNALNLHSEFGGRSCLILGNYLVQ